MTSFPRPPFATDEFVQAERRYRDLAAQRDAGRLGAVEFRVEVAKLLLRDEQGVFWMMQPETGEWFCHRGSGWRPGDPGIAAQVAEERPVLSRQSRRRRFLVAGALGLLAVALAVAGIVWRPWAAPGAVVLTPSPGEGVQVTITSPADASDVVVGQDVAVESTIDSGAGRPAVAWVELLAGDELVERRSMAAQSTEPPREQYPLWLSQTWRPAVAGEVPLTIIALAADGRQLGSATIAVHAAGLGPEGGVDPGCTPSAGYVGDVTIPAGQAFPPGARMDKVWQVRNTGACAWGAGYDVKFVAGSQLGAPPSGGVPPTSAGEQADVVITFWAPAAGGVYTSVWQLHSPEGSFFGPTLTLEVAVASQAEEMRPPAAPANLAATPWEGGNGHGVRLTWEDLADDEDAFRIYREQVEAGIGLAPADAESFVDEQAVCGTSYHYTVVAFNAAGGSASNPAEVTVPPCAPASDLPSLLLDAVPAMIQPPATFTITFEAGDDLDVAHIRLWGEGTGDPAIDAGVVITCGEVLCAGYWPLLWTDPASTTLAFAGVAVDSSGQESETARVTVSVRPR